MSSDTAPPGGGNGGRRGSITQAALSNLFQRGSSSGAPPFSAQPNSQMADQRRRLSVNTIGLSGTSPTNTASFMRRGSMSTNSDSIDESAIEDDDMLNGGPKTAPTTPFVRRMSFGGTAAMRNYRTNGSPGNGNNIPSSPPLPSSLGRRSSMQKPAQMQGPAVVSAALSAAGRRPSAAAMPPSSLPQASNTKYPRVSSDNASSRADQSGFNWSEQFRSRAESSVTGSRPSFSFGSGSGSPPQGGSNHDRAKSVSGDMMQPPAQASTARAKQERPKPDAFQERILKGDFYMD